MTSIRLVVVDDERPAGNFLRALLREFTDVIVVGEAADGTSGREILERERPDLALIDLEMPDMDGLALVGSLPTDSRPLIVFVTAHERHAVHAFEAAAMDYLLKPVEIARLRVTIDRVRTHLEMNEAYGAAVANPERAPLERIPVRQRQEIVLVPVSELVSLTAEGDIVHLATAKERFTLTYRLKDLLARLDPNRFLRIGRGAVVSIPAIASLDPLPGGTYSITMTNGQRLRTSRLQSRIIRERLLRL